MKIDGLLTEKYTNPENHDEFKKEKLFFESNDYSQVTVYEKNIKLSEEQ